jgi:hypothetical protein
MANKTIEVLFAINLSVTNIAISKYPNIISLSSFFCLHKQLKPISMNIHNLNIRVFAQIFT